MASQRHYLAPSPPLSSLLLMLVLLFVVAVNVVSNLYLLCHRLLMAGVCGMGLGCARDLDNSVSPQLLRAGNIEGSQSPLLMLKASVSRAKLAPQVIRKRKICPQGNRLLTSFLFVNNLKKTKINFLKKESRCFTILYYSVQLKKCYQVSNTALSLPPAP